MATHSSILSWEIPWTKDPSGLESMGSQRVSNDLVTKQQQQQTIIHDNIYIFILLNGYTHTWVVLENCDYSDYIA